VPGGAGQGSRDEGITIKSLARIRAGAVSVNEGLADLDRQLNAVLQRR
jgi:hypothetical protein